MDMYANATLFCPNCQADLAVSMPEKNDQGRAPQHGDRTVCSGCLTYLHYYQPAPNELRLDVIDRDEFERLPEQSQAALMQVRGELLARQEHERHAKPTRFETALAIEVTELKHRVQAMEVAACSCLYCQSGDGFNCLYRRRA